MDRWKSGFAKGRPVLVPVNLLGFPSARPEMIGRFDGKPNRQFLVGTKVGGLAREAVLMHPYWLYVIRIRTSVK